KGQGSESHRAIGCEADRSRSIPRLSERIRRSAELENGNVCRLASGDSIVALGRSSFLHPCGETLAATCTEIFIQLRKPPSLYSSASLTPNHIRMRISPEITLAVGAMTLTPTEEMAGQPVEMVASHCPPADEPEAYERLLEEAMVGDATLFAREDYVEEAWRIVDPVLKAGTPVYEYEPGTWGPKEVESVTPPGGWQNPSVPDQPGS